MVVFKLKQFAQQRQQFLAENQHLPVEIPG